MCVDPSAVLHLSAKSREYLIKYYHKFRILSNATLCHLAYEDRISSKYGTLSNYGTPPLLGPWNICHHKSLMLVVDIFSLKTPYKDLLQTNGTLNVHMCTLPQELPYFSHLNCISTFINSVPPQKLGSWHPSTIIRGNTVFRFRQYLQNLAHLVNTQLSL